jgi:alanyl-tRNA synthetase
MNSTEKSILKDVKNVELLATAAFLDKTERFTGETLFEFHDSYGLPVNTSLNVIKENKLLEKSIESFKENFDNSLSGLGKERFCELVIEGYREAEEKKYGKMS